VKARGGGEGGGGGGGGSGGGKEALCGEKEGDGADGSAAGHSCDRTAEYPLASALSAVDAFPVCVLCVCVVCGCVGVWVCMDA